MAALVLVTTILFMMGDEGLALHGQEERSDWAGEGGCVFSACINVPFFARARAYASCSCTDP